jgi:bla regulator protein blaR1
VSTSLLLPLQSWPEALGWSLLLALGETSLLAFVVRGLFHRAGRPTAARRYRLAWSALWIGAALWAASLGAALHPVAMGETARRSLDVLIRLPALAGSHGSAAGSTPSVRGAADPALYGHITPVLAWVWLAVAAVLLVRLAGGWLLARQILARASHVTNERALEAFRALADRLRVRRVELRESAELDAPGTVSGSPPSVVFPAGLVDELPPDAFEGLAAHELGHVVGRDSTAALAQAVLDALLFFCPGARWLSGRAREAREHWGGLSKARAGGSPVRRGR